MTRPLHAQGFYVNAQVASDWRPGETRTYYLYSPFAQGVNSAAQVKRRTVVLQPRFAALAVRVCGGPGLESSQGWQRMRSRAPRTHALPPPVFETRCSRVSVFDAPGLLIRPPGALTTKCAPT